MSIEIILDNEYATLWYYPEAGIVHHKFHRFIYGEKFREVLDKGAEFFKEKGATKWLSDDRLNSALPKEDGIWALGDWNPRMRAAGWKYWAVVFPDKKAGQVNLNYFLQQGYTQNIVTQAFDNAEEALHWLETVDQTTPV